MPPLDLTQRVQDLLSQRQRHADELVRIDQTLAQIGTALQGLVNGARRGPGRPRAAAKQWLPAEPTQRRRRGRRGSYKTTADELILSVVGQRGATTQQIKEAWKREGRGGTADNALSIMVRNGKLKRMKLKGQRGSTFTAP